MPANRVQIHSKLMLTCTIFAQWTSWLTRELEKTDPDLSMSNKPPTMTEDHWRLFLATKSTSSRPAGPDASMNDDAEARLANMSDIIRKWEVNFSKHLQILLDALNHYAATETVVLLSLCARLSTANQGTEYSGLRADEDASVLAAAT